MSLKNPSNFSIDKYKGKTVQTSHNENTNPSICTVTEQADHDFPAYLLHYSILFIDFSLNR